MPPSAFLIIGSDKKQTAHISLLATLFRTMPLKRVAAKLGVRGKKKRKHQPFVVVVLNGLDYKSDSYRRTRINTPVWVTCLLFACIQKAEIMFVRAEYVSADA